MQYKYNKYHGPAAEKRKLKDNFNILRKNFDRLYRKFKRAHDREKQLNIQKLNTNNPKLFWQEVNKLGPSKSRDVIPMEVMLDDGSISSEIPVVKNKWSTDLESVYNDIKGDYNDEFLTVIKSIPPDIGYTDPRGEELCLPITVDETLKAISMAKVGKASGSDEIPAEILKCPRLHGILHTLFSCIFENGVVPKEWTKVIIHPIPKKGKEPRVPINNRGISLISASGKIFANILFKRLQKYLEINSLLCDEQNAYWPNRNCIDHLFSLTTVVRNRLVEKNDTYVCCGINSNVSVFKVNFSQS